MGIWGPPSGISLCPRGGAHVAPVAGRPVWVWGRAVRLRCVLGAEAFVLTWGPFFFPFHFGLYIVNHLSHTYLRLYHVCNNGEGDPCQHGHHDVRVAGLCSFRFVSLAPRERGEPLWGPGSMTLVLSLWHWRLQGAIAQMATSPATSGHSHSCCRQVPCSSLSFRENWVGASGSLDF